MQTLKTAGLVAVATILVALGWSLLLTAFGLAIERADTLGNDRISILTQAIRVGMCLFLGVQIALGFLITRSGLFGPHQFRKLWHFPSVILAGTFVCFLLSLLSLGSRDTPRVVQVVVRSLSPRLIAASTFLFR